MSDLWIAALPVEIMKSLPALALVLVGFAVEKKFVGRTATFANGIAINLQAILVSNPNWQIVWYANIGLVMGVIGLVAYQSSTPLSKYYYYASWAYCSVVAGLFIIFVH